MVSLLAVQCGWRSATDRTTSSVVFSSAECRWMQLLSASGLLFSEIGSKILIIEVKRLKLCGRDESVHVLDCC